MINKDELINYNKYLKSISELKEVVWINPKLEPYEEVISIGTAQIDDAEHRLNKFAPLIEILFPETKSSAGIIESPLKEIENMRKKLDTSYHARISGKLLLKMDSRLAIAGSVKARGGIYEVIKYAESLALNNDVKNGK